MKIINTIQKKKLYFFDYVNIILGKLFVLIIEVVSNEHFFSFRLLNLAYI